MRPLSNFGMLKLHKVPAFTQMLVGCQILVAHRRKSGDAGALQDFGDFPSVATDGPSADYRIEFLFVLLARRRCRESQIRNQLGLTHYPTQGAPLSFGSDRDTNPLVRVAGGFVGVV